MSERRIYVACLSAYNNGKLHGAWIEAESDLENMMEKIQGMLKNSPEPNAEEWDIHDLDGIPRGITCVQEVADYMQIIEDHADYSNEIIEAAWGLSCNTDQFKGYLENYAGSGDSEKDWCESYLQETGFFEGVAEHFEMYFDTEAYVRDMNYNGDIATADVNGTTYVFWNNF